MNLLYTLTAYPPATGGAQLLQHLLARHLSSRHEIQTVCFWDQNRTDWLLGTTLSAHTEAYDYVQDGIPVHRIGLSLQNKLFMLPFVPLYYPAMEIALPMIAQIIEQYIKQ